MSDIASSISEGVSNAVRPNQKTANFYIFFPILLLCSVGLTFNWLANSGVNVYNNYISGAPYPCVYQNSNPTACPFVYNPPVQSSSNCVTQNPNCNVTNTAAIPFLNANSPFTYLIELNPYGFLSELLNGAETPNTYTLGYTGCFATNSSYIVQNYTGSGINNFQCYAFVSNNGVSTASNPTIVEIINATSNNGNQSIYSVYGCPFVNSHQANPNDTTIGGKATSCGINYGGNWALLSGNFFYIVNGTSLTSGQCTILGQTYTTCGVFWRIYFSGGVTTFTCPNQVNDATNHTNLWNSSGTTPKVNLKKTLSYCLIPYQVSNSGTLGSILGFWAFMAGIIILVIGIGINLDVSVAGNGVTIGSNEQGTKQAIILGFFVMLFGFAYSEFGFWLNSLPFGLGIITLLMLGGLSLYGIYWRFFSLG